MPPQLALVLTVLFIGYLLRRDSRAEPKLSWAVWIPVLWLMINGSRQVSQWMGIGVGVMANRLEEGSPVDQAAYSALMIAGLGVLATRRVRLAEILSHNLPIILFLGFAGLSVLWSEFPLITFRRWVKALGDPVMILILWTDPSPARAITATIKRCAYVLIPLSVLFCKYYENLGRNFSTWGASSYTGVTLDKNMLGYLLFVYGLFFVATLLTTTASPQGDKQGQRYAKVPELVLLLMVGWLFMIANSKTALLATIVGVIVMVAARFAVIRRHFWPYAFAAMLMTTVLDTVFSVTSAVAEAAGRDVTFTGRTGLWETVLQEPINPIVGVGYASFWLGERLTRFWDMYPTSPPIQAHNGYIEVYLNLGLIGLGLVVWILWSGLRRMRRRMPASVNANEAFDVRLVSTFGIAFGIAYLFYNVTEATFQGLNPLFVIFMILSNDLSQKQHSKASIEHRSTRRPATVAPSAKWRPVARTRPAVRYREFDRR